MNLPQATLLTAALCLTAALSFPATATGDDLTGQTPAPALTEAPGAAAPPSPPPIETRLTAANCPDTGFIPGEHRYCVADRYLCVWQGDDLLGCATLELRAGSYPEDEAERIFPAREASRVGFRAFTRY